MSLRPLPIVLAALLVLAAACELPRSHGDANAIIIGAAPELWSEISPIVEQGLEPTIQTVREERTFRLTHQDPTIGDHWGNLRRFRQVLVIGGPDDPWVAQAIEARRDDEPISPPALFEVTNVWARDQVVSVLVLPEEGRAEAVAGLLDPLRETLDQRFRRYVLNRMYVSGRDSILADSLAREVGFSMLLPNVYRLSVEDSVFRFRNANPSPTERIRELGVTWWEPAPEELPTRAELEEWRVEFAERYYVDPQLLDTMIVSYGDVAVDGLEGVEYQSAWVNAPGGWISGGPFITRVLRCPGQDRMYVMDAWLYAPNQEKYEFMIQLQTILDSFRCH